MFRMLLDAGAGSSMNTSNSIDGWTPVFYIAKNFMSAKELPLLVSKYGADVNVPNTINGKTPLEFALEIHDNYMARCLQEAGARISPAGETALVDAQRA